MRAGGKCAGAPGREQQSEPTARAVSKQRPEDSNARPKAQPVALKKRRFRESRRTDGTLSSITQELMDSVLAMTRKQVADKLRWLGCPVRGSTSKLKENLRAQILDSQVSSEDEETVMGA